VKKVGIYILLFFYVAVQLKPLTVVIQDVFEHAFFKMQHIATVHYENGHYHLHNDLDAINKDEIKRNKAVQSSSNQKTEMESQQILTHIRFNFKTKAFLIPMPVFSNQAIFSGFKQLPYLPPKLL
jgi:hypothetical protein